MILFKRVGESFRHVEGREWALLSLETLGVLIGILLAFSLQEWAQQRSEAAKHRQLMERLFEESEMDVSVLRNVRDVLKGLVAREQAFELNLAHGVCPPQEQWGAAQTISMLPALTAPSSAYQELMGAGGLASVERKDVREALALYHGDLEWSQQQIAYFRQVKEDPVSDRDPRLTISYDPSKAEPEVVTYDRQALCKDHGFTNVYAAALRQHVVFTSHHQRSLENAIAMCIRLGNSVGHHCAPSFGGPLKGADADYAAKITAKMRSDLAGGS